MNERETLKINSLGHLEIGGADAVDLATHKQLDNTPKCSRTN